MNRVQQAVLPPITLLSQRLCASGNVGTGFILSQPSWGNSIPSAPGWRLWWHDLGTSQQPQSSLPFLLAIFKHSIPSFKTFLLEIPRVFSSFHIKHSSLISALLPSLLPHLLSTSPFWGLILFISFSASRPLHQTWSLLKQPPPKLFSLSLSGCLMHLATWVFPTWCLALCPMNMWINPYVSFSQPNWRIHNRVP